MKWNNTLTAEYVMGKEEIKFSIRITEQPTHWDIEITHEDAQFEYDGKQSPMVVQFDTFLSKENNKDIRDAKAVAGKLMRVAYEKIVSGAIIDEMYGNDTGDDDDDDGQPLL